MVYSNVYGSNGSDGRNVYVNGNANCDGGSGGNGEPNYNWYISDITQSIVSNVGWDSGIVAMNTGGSGGDGGSNNEVLCSGWRAYDGGSGSRSDSIFLTLNKSSAWDYSIFNKTAIYAVAQAGKGGNGGNNKESGNAGDGGIGGEGVARREWITNYEGIGRIGGGAVGIV